MKAAVRNTRFVPAFIFIVFLTGVAYLWAQIPKLDQESVEVAQSTPLTVKVGQMGIIYTGLPGATTEEDYEQVIKLTRARRVSIS